MERLALILAITGFCIASGSIALLRITAIKNWFDRVESSIFILSKRYIEAFKKREILSVKDLLKSNIESITTDQFVLPKRLFETILFRFCLIWFRNDPEIKILIKDRLLLISENIQLRLRVLRNGLLSFPIFVTFLILFVLHKVAVFLVKVSGGKEIITSFFVVIGTIILLAGLVLELISKF